MLLLQHGNLLLPRLYDWVWDRGSGCCADRMNTARLHAHGGRCRRLRLRGWHDSWRDSWHGSQGRLGCREGLLHGRLQHARGVGCDGSQNVIQASHRGAGILHRCWLRARAGGKQRIQMDLCGVRHPCRDSWGPLLLLLLRSGELYSWRSGARWHAGNRSCSHMCCQPDWCTGRRVVHGVQRRRGPEQRC